MNRRSKDSHPKSAYASPLDAIVLAGTDDNPRRMIQSQNKAFLEIGGRVLVCRVVDALLEASSIGQIFVVGPRERLARILENKSPQVTIVEQAGTMLANAWQAIHAVEARHRELNGVDDPLRPMLFVSCDLPFISGVAVDDFVSRCAGEDSRSAAKHGMLAGVAEEASLSVFHPDEGSEGIIRPFVHLSDCRVRLANIYVGRPRTLLHQEFLQTGFEHRKAEKWKNVLILTLKFLGQPGGWKAAWITLKLQVTLLAWKGRGGLYRRLRKRNRADRVEQACSTVLGGSVRMVITPYGGLSLDVDNEDDYRILSRKFNDWVDAEPVEPGS
jgi:GTP:adenosylcobinamide-phosphate guanylyltransferase